MKQEVQHEMKKALDDSGSGFLTTIEQALGSEIFGRLHDVKFEDNLHSGAALSFSFEGQDYWLEREGGGFLILSRLDDEGDICILHPKSSEFKEQFLNALIKGITSGT